MEGLHLLTRYLASRCLCPMCMASQDFGFQDLLLVENLSICWIWKDVEDLYEEGLYIYRFFEQAVFFLLIKSQF